MMEQWNNLIRKHRPVSDAKKGAVGNRTKWIQNRHKDHHKDHKAATNHCHTGKSSSIKSWRTSACIRYENDEITKKQTLNDFNDL